MSEKGSRSEGLSALLKWVRAILSPQQVSVPDFSLTVWQDGVGFGALLNGIQPGLVSLVTVREGTARENLLHVFSLAASNLGVLLAPSVHVAVRVLLESTEYEPTWLDTDADVDTPPKSEDSVVVIEYVLRFYRCFREYSRKQRETTRYQRSALSRLEVKHQQLLREIEHIQEDLSRAQSYQEQLIRGNERVRFEKDYANEQLELVQDQLKSLEKEVRIERNLRMDAQRNLDSMRRRLTHQSSSSNLLSPTSGKTSTTTPNRSTSSSAPCDVSSIVDGPDLIKEIHDLRRALLAAHQERIFLKRKLAEEYQTTASLQERVLGLPPQSVGPTRTAADSTPSSSSPSSSTPSSKPPLLRANTSRDVRSSGMAATDSPDLDQANLKNRHLQRELDRCRAELEQAKKTARERQHKMKRMTTQVSELQEDLESQQTRAKKEVEKFKRRFEMARQQLAEERETVTELRQQLRHLRLQSRSSEALVDAEQLAERLAESSDSQRQKDHDLDEAP
mmetsp:Transcript_45238/g.113871  ORF Transcript_45238/g.113871 Transcript_45238/m.113871 type:complete len:506 (+) Transcript_45238:95-1612(+)|eukprot:CAMPEP_0174240168 /NCGR_PEP_ID=MMETSP0417-20130205/17723_1 /TAXON_ID=242541 /ORGANISM="Mayorella sp, Strain BSH-02190019" /LENGTH=505 /DNA_ID=CAMNT_0015319209 /DNA_START=79 /DNA_END=1596 /DNA_ORIENTATION=-